MNDLVYWGARRPSLQALRCVRACETLYAVMAAVCEGRSRLQ